MASRHLIQRGITAALRLRPASVCLLSRNSVIQRPVTIATCQPAALQGGAQRTLQWTNQSAGFHSSRCMQDENHMIIQDEDDFKEKVLATDDVIVVDFHATWCNPCKALAPALEAVIDNTQGQVKLAKVDIDDLQDLAINYRVNSVPTVMAFKGGQEVGKFIGLKSQQDIQVFVEKLLK